MKSFLVEQQREIEENEGAIPIDNEGQKHDPHSHSEKKGNEGGMGILDEIGHYPMIVAWNLPEADGNDERVDTCVHMQGRG